MSVELRPAQPDDFERLYRWRADNNEYFFGEPPTPEGHRHWIQTAYEDATQRLFVIVTPQPVGTISLYDIDLLHRRAEYGRFVVERAARGNGYGRAALGRVLRYVFETLGLNRVYADILLDNQAGRAVARSCGFRPEGVFWEHTCKDGVYRDVMRVALLRDEWYIYRAGS